MYNDKTIADLLSTLDGEHKMPMIKNKRSMDVSSIKAKVNPAALEQIESYCHWAGIYDLGYFIEKAAHELLIRDPEWLQYLEQLENTVESN